jgi:hypothetical protein
MKAHRKVWLVLVISFMALLLIISVAPDSTTSTVSNAVTISFVGYTNPPGNVTRFALFWVSNAATCSIHWRNNWVEVEGHPDHMARTVNRTLPGYTYDAVLRSGRSMPMAVAEPFDSTESGRWKFVMMYSPYRIQEWWLDLSFQHNLPLKLGPLVLVDSQRVLNPSNFVTINSEWLTK